jgi:poly [ADP-ribose] polymerase
MSQPSQTVMLVLVSSDQNNNKFYEVSLSEDGVVNKRWGRVGSKGQASSEPSGQAGFDKIIKAKQKKGYKRVNIVQDTAEPNSQQLRLISRKSLAVDAQDQKVVQLIDRLVEKNRHQILTQSGGMIQIESDGVLKTPLGIIDAQSLHKARKVLSGLKNDNIPASVYKAYLDEYLTLVPQKVAFKRGWEKDFFQDSSIAQQEDLLLQLEKSFEWYQSERENAQTTNPTSLSCTFKYQLRTLGKDGSDRKEFERIRKLFMSSRNLKHHADVKHKRLHALYEIIEPNSQDFAKLSEELGRVKELWHGTGVANILSILRKGLVVPSVKDRTISIAGRMLGHGVYHSTSSTKSLRYATGAWHHKKESDCFMFLNQVACGKTYKPKHPSDYKKAYKSHNSIWLEPGAGVLNNEVVVWEPAQVLPKYLCEFN